MIQTHPLCSALLLMLAGLIGCAAPRQQPATTPIGSGADSEAAAGAGTSSAKPTSQPDTLDPATSAELENLIRDVCGKSVVLLGEEPRHGGERTLEIKAALVLRLIDRCGFNAVYFESGVYEFVDLNRRLANGSSAPEQIADAIGGLWSASHAFDPFAGGLYARASAGKIRLGGIDAQLGSATSGYARKALASDLVGRMDEPRRSACAEAIARNTNWTYDAQHPYDDAARESLNLCFREAAASLPADSPAATLARAAAAISADLPGGMPWRETRERQLAELFRWHQRQAPEKSKAIVWTANVHAASFVENLNGPVRPLGDELRAEYGNRMASIAFIALTGSYGYRRTFLIPGVTSSSLEARALTAGATPLVYLYKPDLARFGPIEGSLLGYGRTNVADWSSLFDGVLVLREERPMSMDYGPAPRFVPPDAVKPD